MFQSSSSENVFLISRRSWEAPGCTAKIKYSKGSELCTQTPDSDSYKAVNLSLGFPPAAQASSVNTGFPRQPCRQGRRGLRHDACQARHYHCKALDEPHVYWQAYRRQLSAAFPAVKSNRQRRKQSRKNESDKNEKLMLRNSAGL